MATIKCVISFSENGFGYQFEVRAMTVEGLLKAFSQNLIGVAFHEYSMLSPTEKADNKAIIIDDIHISFDS